MRSTILWVVLAVIVLGGGWWYYATYYNASSVTPSTDTTTNNNPNGTDTSPQNTGQTGSSSPIQATVTYSDVGFSPKSVTIAKGGTITFVNSSTHQMWVGSAPHPAHSGYDGTTRDQHCATGYTGAKPFDECQSVAPGGSFVFTFDKVGAWPYHNHDASSDFGSITVTAQ